MLFRHQLINQPRLEYLMILKKKNMLKFNKQNTFDDYFLQVIKLIKKKNIIIFIMKLKKLQKLKNKSPKILSDYLDEYKSHRNKILKLVDRVFKSKFDFINEVKNFEKNSQDL